MGRSDYPPRGGRVRLPPLWWTDQITSSVVEGPSNNPLTPGGSDYLLCDRRVSLPSLWWEDQITHSVVEGSDCSLCTERIRLSSLRWEDQNTPSTTGGSDYLLCEGRVRPPPPCPGWKSVVLPFPSSLQSLCTLGLCGRTTSTVETSGPDSLPTQEFRPRTFLLHQESIIL